MLDNLPLREIYSNADIHVSLCQLIALTAIQLQYGLEMTMNISLGI